MRTKNFKVVIRAFDKEVVYKYSSFKDANEGFYCTLRWILDKQLHAYYCALCVGDYVDKFYEDIHIQRKTLKL